MRKLNILTLLLVAYFSAWAQEHDHNFSFQDKYGNSLTILQTDKLPHQIDSIFFINNLSALSLGMDTIVKYKLVISELKYSRRRSEFTFTLKVDIENNDISELVKSNGGRTHYRMKVKKERGLLLLQSIEFINGEI